MSYWCSMGFAPVKDLGEAFSVAMQYVKLQMTLDNVQSMLDRNTCFIPTEKVNYVFGENQRNDSVARAANRFWMKDLFTFRFLFWKEYDLLGIVMMQPHETCEKWPLYVEFQNATDQDYAYSEWLLGDIPFFQNAVTKAKALTAEEIHSADPAFSVEEIEKSLEYQRRSFCYKEIVKELGLETWIEGLRGKTPYEVFAINGVTSDTEFFKYSMMLKKYIKNYRD